MYMVSQRMKVYFVKKNFIQSSLSFVIDVICDLSNTTNGILIIEVVCAKKLVVRSSCKSSYSSSDYKPYMMYHITCACYYNHHMKKIRKLLLNQNNAIYGFVFDYFFIIKVQICGNEHDLDFLGFLVHQCIVPKLIKNRTFHK